MGLLMWRENTRAAEDLERQPEIVLPVTGEVINLTQPTHVAQALDQVREWKRRLDDVRAVLVDALRLESERQGTKTLHMDDGVDVVITGGDTIDYDPASLMDALEEAGCPAERIHAACTPTVIHKINRSVLKQLAGANADYRAAIEAAEITVSKPYNAYTKE